MTSSKPLLNVVRFELWTTNGKKRRSSKPLLNVVRFEPLQQWNRKRQCTAKSCVRPTPYDTRPYEALGLAKRQGRKCERHVRF